MKTKPEVRMKQFVTAALGNLYKFLRLLVPKLLASYLWLALANEKHRREMRG